MANSIPSTTANASGNASKTAPVVPTTVPIAEPGPDWPVARKAWGAAWELHWIGFGLCFTLIALFSITAMLRQGKIKSFARKRLFYAVNTLLVTLGFTRALYLLLDPYESRENSIRMPAWFIRPLYGVAFPCLTSAFCLLHVAFLEVTKIQVAPRRIQNVWFVSGIILFHFALVLVTDTIVAVRADQSALLIVCQSFFVAWGFLNSFCFLYSGTKIIVMSRNFKKTTSNEESGSRSTGTSNTAKVAKVTLATSLLGLACSGLQVYSMVGVYGTYSKTVDPQPWPWWVFQTGFRVTELAMACTLLYSVLQSGSRSTKKIQKKRRGVFCSKPSPGNVDANGGNSRKELTQCDAKF